MNKLIESLKSPWIHGGPIAGVLDIILRVAALLMWLGVVWFVLQFLYDAIFIEIIWAQKMWWIGYSALLFTMASIIAYTAVWDRE